MQYHPHLELPEDILLCDKPEGYSSFDVIRTLRRTLNIRKMGHAGTLDPLASGLMIIGIGPGTKLLSRFLALPKAYVADVCFGYRTNTGDNEGTIVEQCTVPRELPESHITEMLSTMIGTLSLYPPAYSAIKQQGVPLYKRARRGEQVTPPLRDMQVHNATLESFETQGEYPVACVYFSVASGVYIRSLAEELGRRAGYPATLTGLRRVSIGSWNIEDAHAIKPFSPQRAPMR